MLNVPRIFIQYNCIPHYRQALFRRLSARTDIEFSIIADNEPDTPFLKTVRDDPRIRHISARTRFLRIPGIPTLYWQWNSLYVIARRRPDAVIALANPYSITAWAIIFLCRVLRIPLILWGQGLLEPETGLKWAIRGTFYRLAKIHLLYGDNGKRLMAEKGIPRERMYVVYNSLNLEAQESIANTLSPADSAKWRAGLGVREGEGLIVFTGRLQPVKRLDLLVAAIGKLASNGKAVHLALIGTGSERSKLAAQASELGVAHLVHFLGETYDEEFLGLVFSASDLCVIPSGAGLTIMHAMAFGCPVLLHDRVELHFPEWEAVIEGRTGYFYRFGDQDDLTHKIEQAIFPAPSKAGMSDACRAIIRERYNPAVQEDIFARAVHETLGRWK